MIEIGNKIQLHYPTNTHVRSIGKAPMLVRKVRIESVRDLSKDPLTVDEFMRRPWINRSRWLIGGKDHLRKSHREFYLGSSKEFAAPGALRLVLFDAATGNIEDLGIPEFQATVKDRRLLIALIKHWNSIDHGDADLRVLSNDLRLVS